MTTESNSHNVEADIVIVGSGGGIVAAVTVAEAGAKVIVLEKQGVLGGNTRLAFGLWACESPVQKRANMVMHDRDYYFKVAMKWSHCSRINPRVIRAYIDRAGDTIRWLEEKGIEFNPLSPDWPDGPHSPVGRGQGLMNKLIGSAEKLGVTSFLNTSGQKIIRGEDGTVSGIVAVKEGQEFLINAKCVIIATGGFSGNRVLLKKYCPDYRDTMHTGNWPHHTGDGLLMADEAGAAIADTIPISHVGPAPDNISWRGMMSISQERCTVWINRMGQRFTDEAGYGRNENGNAILMQPGTVSYTIFDDDIRQQILSKMIPPPDEDQSETSQGQKPPDSDSRFQACIEKGYIMEFESLVDMADGLNVDADILQATIMEYNGACERGRDPVFAKDQKYLLALKKAPFYVIKCYTDVGETMGGIKVTERMEAIDKQGNIIPGLYVAGVLADGWSGQTYCSDEMGGSAMGFAINSGRIAGENAAGYIENL